MNKNQLKQFIIAKIYGKQGFSVNIKGQASRNGYMSGFNEALLKKDVEAITAGEIDRWVEDNFLTLAEDKNLYAGGWEKDGIYYLEISRNIGILLAAKEFAQKHNQIAIWDCENDEEIIIKYLREHFARLSDDDTNFAINQLNDVFSSFHKIFSPKN